MNKKQILVLALAIVTIPAIVLFNFGDVFSMLESNAATVTFMVDQRPMLAELAIAVIFFGTLLVLFKTPGKRS
jgi:hypothetical protein